MFDTTTSERMAAVGDYESVLPFQAVGVDPYFLGEDASDVELLLRRLSREYAVVFLVESCFEDHRNLIDDLNDEFSVSLIPIPSQTGARGVGVENIRSSVERAVGMDIFSVES